MLLSEALIVLSDLLLKSVQVSAVIQKAQAEGRTSLNAEERAGILAVDNSAIDRLTKAVSV